MMGKCWLWVPVLTLMTIGTVKAEAPICCSAEELACKSWWELEQIYRMAKPGPLPIGYLNGQVVFPDHEPMPGLRREVVTFMWQGKHFYDGGLINQFRKRCRIRACVYSGQSWLDGQPAHILDYQHTSHVWRDVRDEMRMVCPGVYLGAMYLRRCPHPRLKLFFILH